MGCCLKRTSSAASRVSPQSPRSLFKLVVIDLDAEDDAQVIFESLNARHTASRYRPCQEPRVPARGAIRSRPRTLTVSTQIAGPSFDRDYWREEVVQGRLRRPRAELFLMHWLTMRTGRGGTGPNIIVWRPSSAYSSRRHSLLPTRSTSSPRIGIGTRTSFSSRSGSIPQRFFEEARRHLTPRPPTRLLSFSSVIKSLGPQRNSALLMLESWLVRRMICRFTAQGYNRLFVDLVKLLTAARRRRR